MTLRAHLVLLTLVTLLPLAIFGSFTTALTVQRERTVFERGARERTLALLTALDTELGSHLTSLQGLASSRRLEIGDVDAFRDEASRTLLSQPHWRSVSLSLPSGHRLFVTSEPSDEPSSSSGPRAGGIRGVTRPTVGNLVTTGTGYTIPVHVPVIRNGEPAYLLSATVDPVAVLILLSQQLLPPDWVGVVLDADRRIVARTIAHHALLGQPASESLRAALDAESAGWFHGATIEGAEVYTPFNRSPTTGWTVAVGIPAAVVDTASVSAAWMLGLGTVATVGLAFVLAMLLGRRISDPILSLASVAAELRGGAPIGRPARPSGVREVDTVRMALTVASAEIRERENQLREADQAKNEFLAMLGHELRNPLAALTSAQAVLTKAAPDDTRRDAAVGAIGRQVHHMTRLLDDLLDVARVTTGRIELSRRPLNLAVTVTRALHAIRSAGHLDRHEVATELSPAWVDGDETRLEQVVSNLVINAAKYTPPGGRITVRVSARGRDALLEIADTGIGVAPDLLPHVFDLFVQGSSSLDRRTGGLGIGLTLVKRIVEMHGGRVGAASAGEGRGSTFEVVLPAIGAPRGEQAEPRPPAPEAPGCRVVLVEDNDDARVLTRMALEHDGYTVIEAADGPAGLQAVADARPDAVIVDLGLPGLDGYEVARRLRATPEGPALALIALTGYGNAEARLRAREAGFDSHVTKPVSPGSLGTLIGRLVAARRGP